jgi:voltage-gated potassium channel
LVIHANYELFALALAVLQVVNSVLWVLLRNQEEGRVILLTTVGISLFFIADSAYRWLRAPDRRRFLSRRRGWLLWLGSLPVPFIALLRILWYWWTIRNLRRSDYSHLVQIVVEKRAQSTLLVAILAALVVVEAAATLILGVESKSPEANILTAGDAEWWTIVTMATVGYGDKYPVTAAGRVIAVFVMIVGVGLFGVLTSFLAQWFVRARRTDNANPVAAPASVEDVQALLARLDTLNALLEQQGAAQQADAADLRARLAAIENRLAQEYTVPRP